MTKDNVQKPDGEKMEEQLMAVTRERDELRLAGLGFRSRLCEFHQENTDRLSRIRHEFTYCPMCDRGKFIDALGKQTDLIAKQKKAIVVAGELIREMRDEIIRLNAELDAVPSRLICRICGAAYPEKHRSPCEVQP